ncbi:histidine kinase [Desulfoscipio geothermicus]|uniref:histidine kinase n=1 Tax=Desulfoscipio geothermicus DSM 3669 TaxID=1121426 RepID=A0A1I6DWZ9_9FIRM|nr:histidine kinase [Desulfoscipio geothermicus]SFR09965.1 two-component system, LytT family, sensor kinase [Desulfoscipio geothermicus DSM 3669]
MSGKQNPAHQVLLCWVAAYAASLGIIYFWQPHLWSAAGLLTLSGLTSTLFSIYKLTRTGHDNTGYDEPLDPTLHIANQTLPILRQGLNEETAQKTAQIIRRSADVAAVAITDRERVLAYIGAGSDHHKAGGPIMTVATKEVIQTGEIKVVRDGYGLDCPVPNCPLQSAVIVPLQCRGEIVGTVKLYQTQQGAMPHSVVKLAVGVAQLLGMQMELAEVDRQAQLVTKAELDALQAQINPHFLFNTLNTIIMFSRTNPETARRLLIRLASFFRHALKRHGHFNTLKEEIEYLNTYLVLERARFRDKLRVVREIDEELLEYKVPVLTIQPLVENAIKHGILPKPGQGTVQITVSRHENEMLLVIRDDGVGIDPALQSKVLTPGFGSGNGVGLSNVHERLKGLFGKEYGLRIVSVPNEGTSIYVRIPLMKKEITSEKEGAAGEA